MLATAPWENHPTWKDGWCKLILQKKPVRLKEWMIDRNSFVQIWQTTLKNERLQADIWKNVLPLQNLIPQINPPNNSCSQKQQYSNKKIKAKLSTPKEQLFGGGSFSEGHPSKCKVYYCSSIKFTLINVVKWQSIFQYMHTWNQGSIIEISVNTLSIRNSWLRVFF